MTDHSLVPMAARAGGHRLRGAGVAGARNQLHARAAAPAAASMCSNRARRTARKAPSEPRAGQLPALPWRRAGPRIGCWRGCSPSRGCWSSLGARPAHRARSSVAGRFQRVAPGWTWSARSRSSVRGKGLRERGSGPGAARRCEALPWVDTVERAARLAARPHVTSVEQVAAARWGENGLLNTRGELFVTDAAHIPPELPRLSGPDGTEVERRAALPRAAGAAGRSRACASRRCAWMRAAPGKWISTTA